MTPEQFKEAQAIIGCMYRLSGICGVYLYKHGTMPTEDAEDLICAALKRWLRSVSREVDISWHGDADGWIVSTNNGSWYAEAPTELEALILCAGRVKNQDAEWS